MWLVCSIPVTLRSAIHLPKARTFFFTGIPSFSPEIFKEVINKDPMKTKQLEKGLLQLTDEGVAQLFTQFGGNKKDHWLCGRPAV